MPQICSNSMLLLNSQNISLYLFTKRRNTSLFLIIDFGVIGKTFNQVIFFYQNWGPVFNIVVLISPVPIADLKKTYQKYTQLKQQINTRKNVWKYISLKKNTKGSKYQRYNHPFKCTPNSSTNSSLLNNLSPSRRKILES